MKINSNHPIFYRCHNTIRILLSEQLYWKVKTKTSIPKISDIRSLLWHQIIKQRI